MKGYGSNREVKTSKHITIVKDGREGEIEEHNGSYNWKDLNGEIALTIRVDGQNITLLKLPESMYNTVNLSIRSEDEIEEIVQKQLEVKEVKH